VANKSDPNDDKPARDAETSSPATQSAPAAPTRGGRRFLLVSTALSTATFALATASSACHKERPLPGNPKGSTYDDQSNNVMPANPKGSTYDEHVSPPPSLDASTDAASTTASSAPPPPPQKDAGPVIRPLPGNPKGSHYDKGKRDGGPKTPFE